MVLRSNQNRYACVPTFLAVSCPCYAKLYCMCSLDAVRVTEYLDTTHLFCYFFLNDLIISCVITSSRINFRITQFRSFFHERVFKNETLNAALLISNRQYFLSKEWTYLSPTSESSNKKIWSTKVLFSSCNGFFSEKDTSKVLWGVFFEIQAEIQVHRLSSALQTVFDEITRITWKNPPRVRRLVAAQVVSTYYFHTTITRWLSTLRCNWHGSK